MKRRLTITFLATLAVTASAACASPEGDPELSDEFKSNPSGETIVRWSQNNFTILTDRKSTRLNSSHRL